MESIYREYTMWFEENTIEGVEAVSTDHLLSNCICVDEYGNHILAYYLQYISPSESLSGELELFIIEEKSEAVFEFGDLTSIKPLNYRRR